MNKRYQVFLSSTKKDLEIVRRNIALALLEDKFIPVGMEQFGAAPIDSWELIKKFIDQCDYYVVLVGGKYGSIHPEKKLSFTECEFDYAVERGIPILAFLHRDPQKLTGEQLENSPAKRKMLDTFRNKIERQSKINVDYWDNEDQLIRQVQVSLSKATDLVPRLGWIPGNSIPKDLEKETEAILTTCRSQGITRVSSHGVADPRSMEANIELSKEIRFITTSGTRFLDAYKRSISKAIAKGASIKILVPKPDSIFVQDVGESEREGKGGKERQEEISQEIREVERRLAEYLQEAKRLASTSPQGLGKVYVGYYTTHLRSTIILCDDRWAWLTITLPPLRASESLSFEISHAGEDSILNGCLRHFDRTWSIIEARNDVKSLE